MLRILGLWPTQPEQVQVGQASLGYLREHWLPGQQAGDIPKA